MFDKAKEIQDIYRAAGEPSYLRYRIYTAWEQFWVGRYAELEKECREVLEIGRSSQDSEQMLRRTRDLALYLGLQEKCAEALATGEEGLALARSWGSEGEVEVHTALTYYGIACIKCGKLDRAEEYLSQAITIAQKFRVYAGVVSLYLATIYEMLKEFEKAKYFYQLSLADSHQMGRNYFLCGALTGLVRVKYAQSDYAAIPSLLAEAERLAQQYEYNDHFASLYLTQGHIIWDDHIPEWGDGFGSVLHSYQHTLIYALRYNRLLLDEVLSGREQGTPLQPVIQHCLDHGQEGQQMLMALRDWWQTGINDIGTPRPDTISPLPEGIPLLEAERIARHREPGDGSSHRGVVEQINAVLRKAHGG